MKNVAGEGKKSAKFWAPHPSGPHLSGLHKFCLYPEKSLEHNRTKFYEKTLKEGSSGGKGKKNAKFWAPPTLRGPTLRSPTITETRTKNGLAKID